MALDDKFPVMLTFDVDGEALWLNRDRGNADRPVTLSQGRYGPTVGLPKILAVLAKYEIKATFFVPGWIAENHPDAIRRIDSEGHEVGHHGYLHEWLTRLEPTEEEPILKRGIAAIESVIGKRPVGYRAPAWELTSQSIALLAKHEFAYSSNMMDADGPYRHTTEHGSVIELPVDWTLDDTSLYLYSLQIPGSKLTPNADVIDMWCGSFDGLYRDGSSCVLTIHPQITGRSYRLAALEAFINHVLETDAVFVRCDEAASHFANSTSEDAQ